MPPVCCERACTRTVITKAGTVTRAPLPRTVLRCAVWRRTRSCWDDCATVTRTRSSYWSGDTNNPCCGLLVRWCRVMRWPRRRCRTHGWASSGGSSNSKVAPRCAPGCSGSSSTGRSQPARANGAPEVASPPADQTDEGPAVEPSFFDRRGSWIEPVVRWGEEHEDRLDAATMAPFLKVALDNLPPRQRQVVLLRDLEGLSGSEVCDVLGVSAGNQRLLLHRGRNQLRRDLETVVRRG